MCDLKQYGDLVQCKECTRFWVGLETVACPHETVAPQPSHLMKAVTLVAASVALWLLAWRVGGDWLGWWQAGG